MDLEGLAGRLIARLQSKDLVEAWGAKMAVELEQEAFQRDPAFIERLLPLMELFVSYFDAEVRGLARVPAKSPVLMVGNHSGGTLTPDTSALIAAWYRARGADDPLLLLALDALFAIPKFNTLCRKLGLIPASEGNADRALADGLSLLVYPGGAREAFRPYRERNRIDFAGRKGFVKLALRTGVTVVPVVGQGAHDSLYVLSRGDQIAAQMGMDRMRLGIMPVLVQAPWGLSTPMFPGIPLPAKIIVEVCPPLDWSAYGPDDARDPGVLQRCYDEITDVMQATLTRLAEENPYPLLSRFSRRHAATRSTP